MRLVFAGTPQVAADTLSRLLAGSHHEVVAVLTRPDAPQGRSSRPVPSPVAELALARGLEVLRPERAGDPVLADRLAELAPDCCPVVAYGGLIPSGLLRLPAHGWVNVHYSLLPRWRGAAPVQRAILAGDEITGVTVFELVKELDAGPVLASAEYRLGELETAGEALAGLTDLGADLLRTTLDALADGSAVGTAQPTDRITLAPKLGVADARIDWSRPAVELARQIRASNPAPMAWTELAGERFRILLARPGDASGLEPGHVRLEKRRVVAGTGAGELELLSVQPAGRKPLAGPDWGRGLRGPAVFR
jgi:methionyl-tRNA formyltransferase